MKAYQPDHPQLLINTDWGREAAGVPARELAQKALVRWKGRLVTRAERERLRNESHTYRAIRVVGWFWLAFSSWDAVGIFSALLSRGRIDLTMSAYLVLSTCGVVAGIGIVRYRNWARWTVIGTMVLGLVALAVARDWSAAPGGPLSLLFLLASAGVFCLFLAGYLINSNANLIFGPPAEQGEGHPEVTHSGHLARDAA